MWLEGACAGACQWPESRLAQSLPGRDGDEKCVVDEVVRLVVIKMMMMTRTHSVYPSILIDSSDNRFLWFNLKNFNPWTHVCCAETRDNDAVYE